MTEERHGDERGEQEETSHCVEEKPGEMCWRSARGLLEKTGISLEEVDVEEEVEREGAEVEECCEQAPVLSGVYS